MREFKPKYEALLNKDVFVLDNSLRETTVGQLHGHTIENKWQIYNQVKKVGFKHTIVASFSHMTRIGDTFIQQLHDAGEDMETKYAFSEFIENYGGESKMPQDDLPVGLQKCKKLGIKNIVMEMDLVYHGIDYSKFTFKKMCRLLDLRFKWIRENLAKDSRILVNIRDLPDCIKQKPKRLFKTVNFMASYCPQIFGIVFEESGKYFPEELGVWTKAVKDEMNRCKYTGHLLVHVHQQWGMLDMTQLECLANGATGIWAGLCEEGASMGHACSTNTLMNLVRMGNKKVQNSFNCKELRNAAIAVTEISTGSPPHPKQPIYGARALDHVFGLPQFDPAQDKSFSLADFVGEPSVDRITTLADANMVVHRLELFFGKDPQFTKDMAQKMRELMLEDLRVNRKEEYHSMVGLAVLFDRAGGKLTGKMSDAIGKYQPRAMNVKKLIREIREMWDEWDLKDNEANDYLDFNAFYNGFMGPYFGCYHCDETKRALQALDMDKDNKVDWNEFSLYLKWAGRQYPETNKAEDLLAIAFRKGIIPAMQDELLKQPKPAICYKKQRNIDEYHSDSEDEFDD